MQNDDKTQLFEQMPVPQAVMKLTVPMVLSSLATIIYNMADTFFVGMLNDPIQSAAVSLAAPLMLAFNVVSNLFGTGTSSMMSRSLGAKDYKAVRQSSSFGFYSTLFFDLLFSILYVAFRHPLLGVLGVQQETEAVTSDYLFWIVALGALPSILHMVMMQIVRSEGSSVIASLGIAIGCVTNIIIDPVFVLSWGLNMGAAGAGCATFISNCVSCVYYFVVIHIKREKTYASISPKDFTLDRKIVVGVCGVGIPGGIQTLLNVVQMTILNNFTVGYGTAAMAAMGIAQKIDNVPMNIAMGGASGIMPLVSYTYASGNHSRMKEAILYFIKIMLICLVACSALFFIFSSPLIAVFMNDDSVVMYGSSFLRGFCIALPFFCMDYLTVAVFQALGQGRIAFLFAVARKIVLEIPALYILNYFFHVYGLAYSQFVAELVLSAAGVVLLQWLFRKLKVC